MAPKSALYVARRKSGGSLPTAPCSPLSAEVCAHDPGARRSSSGTTSPTLNSALAWGRGPLAARKAAIYREERMVFNALGPRQRVVVLQVVWWYVAVPRGDDGRGHTAYATSGPLAMPM